MDTQLFNFICINRRQCWMQISNYYSRIRFRCAISIKPDREIKYLSLCQRLVHRSHYTVWESAETVVTTSCSTF